MRTQPLMIALAIGLAAILLPRSDAMADTDTTIVIAKRIGAAEVVDVDRKPLGDMESLMVTNDGGVAIVDVGSYVGGDKDVAIRMSEMRRLPDGRLQVTMGRTTIEGLPDYDYTDPALEGTVFTDEQSVAAWYPICESDADEDCIQRRALE